VRGDVETVEASNMKLYLVFLAVLVAMLAVVQGAAANPAPALAEEPSLAALLRAKRSPAPEPGRHQRNRGTHRAGGNRGRGAY